MECSPLIVLTLLQLCRAEISEILPGTWFSANGINDGYSPKPISEIFSTEPTPSFSPTKPIVVLPNLSSFSPEPEVTHLSTTASSFSPFPSSTPIPLTTFRSSVAPQTTYSDTYSPVSFSQLDLSQTPSLASLWPSTVLQSQSTEKLTSPIQTLQQSLATSPLLPSTQPTGPPNYFVIYQNAPQSIQGIAPPQTSTTKNTPTPVIISTTSSPLTSISEGTITPYITSGLSDPTSRPTITFRSTPKVTLIPSTTPQTTIRTSSKDCKTTTKFVTRGSTRSPLRVLKGAPDVPHKPNLTIRVVAPQGSITNVKINPPTTTKRPPTRKTKKPKKNSIDGCLDGCRGRKDPICAVPLSSVIIDPKTLKGFPSICHLACHNSYKKDSYEKLIDGRCGRLRTRIISVDSNSKIQRDDLKKAEYSVVNTGPKTVLEFTHASHSK